jgi:flavin-dependent dehydrogenase
MPSSDILIVGAGPAGLAAAIALRRRGADVLVADARHPPIDKACGEGLMPDCVRELTGLGVSLDARHGAAFHGIAFLSDTMRVAADFSSGPGRGIRRTTLHQLFLDRALELGVRFSWNTPAILRPAQPLTLAGVPCAYQWLIGADGHTSRVRSWAGLDRGQLRSRRFGFRAHFRIPAGHRDPARPHVEVHWGDLGQAYITPTGPDEVSVSAMTRRSGLRLPDILAAIPSLRGRFGPALATTAERGCLTLTRRLRRVTRNNIALIGDASGSVDAITGEGLALAFRQASLLAESLQSGSLDLYQARHSRLLALQQRMSALLLLLDRHPALRRRTLGALSAHPALFREFLAVHLGEQPLPRFVLRHGAQLGLGILSRRLEPAS